MQLPVIIHQEESWYVATEINSGVTSQGKSIPDAIANLKEAVELYYEGVPDTAIYSNEAFLTTMEVFA